MRVVSENRSEGKGRHAAHRLPPDPYYSWAIEGPLAAKRPKGRFAKYILTWLFQAYLEKLYILSTIVSNQMPGGGRFD